MWWSVIITFQAFTEFLLHHWTKNLFTLLVMIYLGQAGYFCKVSKLVIEMGMTAVNAIPWKQGQKQLVVTSQVFLGFLETSAASGPLAQKRTSLWRFQAQMGLHMWNPGEEVGDKSTEKSESTSSKTIFLKTTHSWWWAMKHWINHIMQCGGTVSDASRKRNRTKPDGMY